jgi:hypothetical protein
MPGATAFTGPAELRAFLLDRQDRFVETVTAALLTYAIGRSLEYYDRPAVRSIVARTAPSGHRWSSLVVDIVKSAPFRMRKTRPSSVETPAGRAGSFVPAGALGSRSR